MGKLITIIENGLVEKAKEFKLSQDTKKRKYEIEDSSFFADIYKRFEENNKRNLFVYGTIGQDNFNFRSSFTEVDKLSQERIEEISKEVFGTYWPTDLVTATQVISLENERQPSSTENTLEQKDVSNMTEAELIEYLDKISEE